MPMVQKNLYNFFKNCFLHWPLDASFKAVSALSVSGMSSSDLSLSAFGSFLRISNIVMICFWKFCSFGSN